MAHVYLNGRVIPREQATLDIEDRGVLFGDGVYEVIRFYGGRGFAVEHRERLQRSLAGIRLAPPPEVVKLPEISQELVRLNGRPEASVYWQITRGPAHPRKHAIPKEVHPTVLVMTYPQPALDLTKSPIPMSVILLPDTRWLRCGIKSLMLLPNILARTQAAEAGADEAIFQRDGVITEASSSNVFVVRGGVIWTHPADGSILQGITRDIVIELACQMGIEVQERMFTVAELLSAEEVFLTGTTIMACPVKSIDGREQPLHSALSSSPVVPRLHQALVETIIRQCGLAP